MPFVEFDLAGRQVDAANPLVLTSSVLPSNVIVTGIRYSYAVAIIDGESYFIDLVFELSSPNLPLSPPTVGEAYTPPERNGMIPPLPPNAETIIWSGDGYVWPTPAEEDSVKVDVNMDFPTNGIGTVYSIGTTDKLNGKNATGEWTLRLYSYYDSTSQYEYQFGAGSSLKIYYTPKNGPLDELAKLGVFMLLATIAAIICVMVISALFW